MLTAFGGAFFINEAEEGLLIALLVAAIVCTVCVIALSIIVVLMLKKRKAAPQRELKEISVDASEAKREFTVGEEFRCNGLLVKAIYASEPNKQTSVEYRVVASDELARLEERGEANGCYVVKPTLSEIGNETVAVKYMGKTASYTVSVSAPRTPHPPEPTKPV